jgi:hypothetical protein
MVIVVNYRPTNYRLDAQTQYLNKRNNYAISAECETK